MEEKEGLEGYSLSRENGQGPLVSKDSDHALIRRAQEGDQRALTALYERYCHRILNYLYRFTGNRSTAEELTQETFYRVVKHLPSYRPIGSVGGWIYQIATNLARREAKKRSSAREISLDEPLDLGEDSVERGEAIPGPGPRPDEEAVKKETDTLVQHSLLKVSPRYREVLVLCDIEGYSYRDVAALLRCPINTVASRLARGRAQLAQFLGYMKREGG